jgi:hypothetical protein
MAIEKPKPSVINELVDIETTIKEAGFAYEKAKRNQILVDRKKQEQAIVDFKLQLEQSNQKLTNEQRKKLEKEFIRDYQAVRVAEERKLIRERFNLEKKNQLEFYKEQSKQAENQRKLEDQQLQKQLEIAKLRSKVVLDEKGNVVGQKDAGKQLLDNLRADLRELGSSIGKSLIGIGEKLSGEVNSVISTFAQYQSSINTRLQGTSSTFTQLQGSLTSGLGVSPFVRTSSMLENLNELVAQGIAFNLEQRAFLDTVSEKIATTFDVANSSLLRIVKLQQEDSTASRLGLEAGLTRYFNEMFQDTQYLSQTFDSVTDALLEATSLMGTKQSVEFEYVVQKWLGSLSAVGTSESTVRSLAEALGYLGAGNVNALSSSSMQNLLVMAASRAGLDYASILTDGLNAVNTNTLLQAVVGYMQEIGQTGNKVVASQFAQTFGLSVSDLRAVGNLTGDLDSITSNMMNYAGTINELGNQLGMIGERVSVAEKIQNVMSNIKFSIGQGIAENAVMAGLWSITDLIQNVTGGIAIPAISVMGNMVDLNTTVENLIKTGLVGVSTLTKLPDLFRGLGQSGDMAGLLDVYGIGNDPTAIIRRRGQGLRGPKGRSTSMASFVGSGDSSGIAAFETQKAMGPAEAQQQKAKEEQKTSNDIFNYLVYLLDPKLSTMTQLLGSMAGYEVTMGGATNSITDQNKYILNYGTSVKVSEPAESQSSKNYEKLEFLSTEVSGIHQLLKNGITVNIGSVSSLTSLAGTVSGLT